MSQWTGRTYCLYLSSPIGVANQVHISDDTNKSAIQKKKMSLKRTYIYSGNSNLHIQW